MKYSDALNETLGGLSGDLAPLLADSQFLRVIDQAAALNEEGRKKIAFIGATGAGKSTIIRSLLCANFAQEKEAGSQESCGLYSTYHCNSDDDGGYAYLDTVGLLNNEVNVSRRMRTSVALEMGIRVSKHFHALVVVLDIKEKKDSLLDLACAVASLLPSLEEMDSLLFVINRASTHEDKTFQQLSKEIKTLMQSVEKKIKSLRKDINKLVEKEDRQKSWERIDKDVKKVTFLTVLRRHLEGKPSHVIMPLVYEDESIDAFRADFFEKVNALQGKGVFVNDFSFDEYDRDRQAFQVVVDNFSNVHSYLIAEYLRDNESLGRRKNDIEKYDSHIDRAQESGKQYNKKIIDEETEELTSRISRVATDNQEKQKRYDELSEEEVKLDIMDEHEAAPYKTVRMGRSIAAKAGSRDRQYFLYDKDHYSYSNQHFGEGGDPGEDKFIPYTSISYQCDNEGVVIVKEDRKAVKIEKDSMIEVPNSSGLAAIFVPTGVQKGMGDFLIRQRGAQDFTYGNERYRYEKKIYIRSFARETMAGGTTGAWAGVLAGFGGAAVKGVTSKAVPLRFVIGLAAGPAFGAIAGGVLGGLIGAIRGAVKEPSSVRARPSKESSIAGKYRAVYKSGYGVDGNCTFSVFVPSRYFPTNARRLEANRREMLALNDQIQKDKKNLSAFSKQLSEQKKGGGIIQATGSVLIESLEEERETLRREIRDLTGKVDSQRRVLEEVDPSLDLVSRYASALGKYATESMKKFPTQYKKYRDMNAPADETMVALVMADDPKRVIQSLFAKSPEVMRFKNGEFSRQLAYFDKTPKADLLPEEVECQRRLRLYFGLCRAYSDTERRYEHINFTLTLYLAGRTDKSEDQVLVTNVLMNELSMSKHLEDDSKIFNMIDNLSDCVIVNYNTLFNEAVSRQCYSVVRKLLQRKGIKVDCVDQEGKTAIERMIFDAGASKKNHELFSLLVLLIKDHSSSVKRIFVGNIHILEGLLRQVVRNKNEDRVKKVVAILEILLSVFDLDERIGLFSSAQSIEAPRATDKASMILNYAGDGGRQLEDQSGSKYFVTQSELRPNFPYVMRRAHITQLADQLPVAGTKSVKLDNALLAAFTASDDKEIIQAHLKCWFGEGNPVVFPLHSIAAWIRLYRGEMLPQLVDYMMKSNLEHRKDCKEDCDFDSSIKANDGYTLLGTAVLCGQASLVKKLLSKKLLSIDIDPNAVSNVTFGKEKRHISPLAIAMGAENSDDLAEQLINHPRLADEAVLEIGLGGESLLHAMVARNQKRLLACFFEKKRGGFGSTLSDKIKQALNDRGETLLHVAIRCDASDCFNYLCKDKDFVAFSSKARDAAGNSLTHLAAASHNRAYVAKLSQMKVCRSDHWGMNSAGKHPLILAQEAGNTYDLELASLKTRALLPAFFVSEGESIGRLTNGYTSDQATKIVDHVVHAVTSEYEFHEFRFQFLRVVDNTQLTKAADSFSGVILGLIEAKHASVALRKDLLARIERRDCGVFNGQLHAAFEELATARTIRIPRVFADIDMVSNKRKAFCWSLEESLRRHFYVSGAIYQGQVQRAHQTLEDVTDITSVFAPIFAGVGGSTVGFLLAALTASKVLISKMVKKKDRVEAGRFVEAFGVCKPGFIDRGVDVEVPIDRSKMEAVSKCLYERYERQIQQCTVALESGRVMIGADDGINVLTTAIANRIFKHIIHAGSEAAEDARGLGTKIKDLFKNLGSAKDVYIESTIFSITDRSLLAVLKEDCGKDHPVRIDRLIKNGHQTVDVWQAGGILVKTGLRNDQGECFIRKGTEAQKSMHHKYGFARISSHSMFKVVWDEGEAWDEVESRGFKKATLGEVQQAQLPAPASAAEKEGGSSCVIS